MYTVFKKLVYLILFVITSAKVDQGNSLCHHDGEVHLTQTTLLYYLVKCENSK